MLSFSVRVLNVLTLENLYFNRDSTSPSLPGDALVSYLKSYFLVRKATSLNCSMRVKSRPSCFEFFFFFHASNLMEHLSTFNVGKVP